MDNLINTIQLGDCYELIKEIPDKSIDLVYIDIPYELSNGGKGSLGYKIQKLKKDLRKQVDLTKGIDFSILDELCRIMKHIYIYIYMVF
jgi:DNA modification methylase